MAAIKILLFTLDSGVEMSFSSALPQEQFYITCVDKLDDILEKAMEDPPDFCIFDEQQTKGEWVDIALSMSEIIDLCHIEKLLIAQDKVTPELVSLAVQAGISEIIHRDIDPLMLLLKIDALILRQERYQLLLRTQQDSAAKRVGYSVEHYAGQPLTAIMGSVQMLNLMKAEGKKLDDPEIEELVRLALKASEDLSSIIHKFANLKSFKIQEHILNHDLIDLDHLDEEVNDGDTELSDFELF